MSIQGRTCRGGPPKPDDSDSTRVESASALRLACRCCVCGDCGAPHIGTLSCAARGCTRWQLAQAHMRHAFRGSIDDAACM